MRLWEDRGLRYNTSRMERTVEAGIGEQGYVTMIVSGTMDWTYEEAYALSALSDGLENRLLEKVREEFGGAYTVSVSARSHSIPLGEYSISVQFSCDPDRTEELTALVKEEMEGFRGKNRPGALCPGHIRIPPPGIRGEHPEQQLDAL